MLSLIAVGFLSFGLWVHHMFATGLPQLGASFFTASSMLIAIPNGVQIFCWIATLWDGRPVFRTPLLFVLGFFFIFVAGGLSGVMLASVPLDLQVHDTYFVVAHFHYVLIGGAVFPLLGAVYYWFPKFTRPDDERAARAAGTSGSPSSASTSPSSRCTSSGYGHAAAGLHLSAGAGLGQPQPVSTVGAVVLLLSFVLFRLERHLERAARRVAGDNPWDAGTLEWATTSPPPPHNFDRIPVVTSREPLWAEREALPVVTGLSVDNRELSSPP